MNTDETNTKGIKYATVKVIPKVKRDKIDYSQTYTANNFLTTIRAFNEYLLNPAYVLNSYWMN